MWVENTLQNGSTCRNPLWMEAIVFGDERFILLTKEKLGGKAIGREPIASDSGFERKEPSAPYQPLFPYEKEVLSLENSYIWDSSCLNTV